MSILSSANTIEALHSNVKLFIENIGYFFFHSDLTENDFPSINLIPKWGLAPGKHSLQSQATMGENSRHGRE